MQEHEAAMFAKEELSAPLREVLRIGMEMNARAWNRPPLPQTQFESWKKKPSNLPSIHLSTL